MNFDLTFKCCRIDFVVYFRILKFFRGGEGDLLIGCLVGFRKVEAKNESSGLCQSCTAEGVRVSVAEGKKSIYGFSNTTDTAFAEIVLHSLPNENRRNVNLPQNNSSYGLAPK